MTKTGRQSVLRFGDFEWRGGEQRLLRAGAPLEIGSRAFDLLGLLASDAGAVVTKERALDHVWPGRIVEENNLQVQISTLRRLLGPGVIATVPGRGYKLTVPVEAGDRPAAPATPGAGHRRADDRRLDIAAPALPAPVALVGREADRAELLAALEAHGIVSLVGEGGIGKSALALAAAHDWLQAAPAGSRRAWLVDLVALAPADDLDAFIASSLGPAAQAALAGAPGLLILDHCEHLADRAAPWIVALRRQATTCRVLITSQVRMRVAGECVLRLAPLALPAADDAAAAEASAAVRLLVQRVRTVDRGFAPGPAHWTLAAEICRALDGLPLALELAAAQVPAIGLSGVRDRLGARLRLLRSGDAGLPERHRTLRATLARSFALLAPDDQRVFRALGVFAGGFELQALAPTLAPLGLDEWALVDALARLVEHCMVVADDVPGRPDRPRYRLHESSRAFAEECWHADDPRHAGERRAVERAHAQWLHDLFKPRDERAGALEVDLQEFFAPELANVRAALDRCFSENGDAALGVALSSCCGDYWQLMSLHAEGRRQMDRAYAALSDDTPPAVEAALCDGVGLIWQNVDPARSLELFARAECIWRELGSARQVRSALGQAWALVNLGREDECERILAATAEAVHGDGRLRAHHRLALGTLHQRRGQWEEARIAMEEALHWRQLMGHYRQALVGMLNLGDLACSAGDLPRALMHNRAAAREAERTDDQALLGRILGNLCTVHLGMDEVDAAEDCARRAVPLLRADGALTWFADPLAWLAARQDRMPAAARLLGYCDGAVATGRIIRQSAEQKVADTTRALLGDHATAAQVAEWAAQGAVMSEAQMVACAFSRHDGAG